MELNNSLLTSIFTDETNEFEKTVIEYFSKIIEIKRQKWNLIQINPLILRKFN